jgi:O-antigen/teichoic acid export membrane protein
LFAAFPVWWVLGLSAFTWIVVAIPMLASLIWRRRARVPVAFILWLAFTSWVLLSGFQLDGGTKIVTFSYRLALYAAAGVLFVYTYNLPRSSRLDIKILRILTVFWMIVVAGGYVGLLVGAHTFTPPFEKLLPGGLRSQPFVQELVQPVFAEVQNFLGFPIPRPAAPFTYSNYWGGNMAVLTPVAIAAALAAGRGARRKLIVAVLVASIVPMVFSLNRGMFLSLGIGVAYMSVRMALRGRLAALGALFGVAALVALVLVATPLGHLVAASFTSTHGHSNTTRLSASQQAIEGARQSPIFGHGEPQAAPGQTYQPPIGTQGQLWMVLYSNGIPATIFFVGFFAAVLWQTRRARGMAGLWLHTVPLVALPQIAVYGWLPVELQVVIVACALAYRYCWRPVARPGPRDRPPPAPPASRDRPAPPPPPAPPPAGRRGRLPAPYPGAMIRPDQPAGVSTESAAVARGSLVNVIAMVTGAVLTFGLTVLVSRWLQPAGAGALFELIALFTIASNTFELGADTGLLRWISRARAVGGLAQVRRVVAAALLPVAIVGTAAAVAIWVAAPDLARAFLHGLRPGEAVAGIRIVAPLVPLGALSSCLVDGARGFGRTWPFLVVEGLGKPTARIILVLCALLAGLGLYGAIAAWGIPVAVGLAASALMFTGILRAEIPVRAAHGGGQGRPPPAEPGSGQDPERHEGRHRRPQGQASGPRSRPGLDFWRFTGPRAFQATFQVVILWLDILLVGAIVSGYAAGVYAAVSKLAVVGTFVLEGNRLAIGPQLSAMLARREYHRAAELFQTATRWLMLASWPLYLAFAIFPAVVLGIFGARYTAGAAALTVLSLAMLVNLGTGNVTVVLLMGGKSSWSAINAAAALVVNIGLNLLLLPRLGIVGAAIAWGASIVVDNVTAMVEVRWVLGIAPFGPGYALVVAMTVGCFGVTGIAARAALGQSLPALAATLAVGTAAFVVAIYAARASLQLDGLVGALRARRNRGELP